MIVTALILGTLTAPAIGTVPLIRGTSAVALMQGVGHYSGTPLPGQPGVAAIAGHRTTHGAPFRRIDRLRRGDRIVVRAKGHASRYAVTHWRIVGPDATWVVRRRPGTWLVLTSCHPVGSAAQRYVVFARRGR